MNIEPANTCISVVIPTYKRGDIFYQCLESVVNSISNQDEIIVVNDDKSAEISVDLVDLKSKKVTILNNPKQGVASARNYGAAHSKGDVLLFVDDDMIINQDAVETSLEFIQRNSRCAINVNWTYPPTVLERLENSSFGRYLLNIGYTNLKGWANEPNWEENTFFNASGIASAFLMIKNNEYKAIGGYNEVFPFAGFEDYDFSNRVVLSGLQSVINTRSLIYHNEIDRVNISEFLKRKERGAYTRKKAVNLGYDELTLHYSFFKKLWYNLLIVNKMLVFFVIKIIPNSKRFDSLYMFFVNRAIGLSIYQGYNH